MLCWRPNENGFTNTKMSVRHRRRRRSLANQSWVEIGGCEPRHDRPMMEAGICQYCSCCTPRRGQSRTWSKVPVEVAFFPAEHERSKRGVAQRKLVVCGRDGERRYVERPDPAETDKGHARKRCADIDIHLHDAWRHGGECDRHGAKNGSGQVLRAIGPHSGRKATRFRAG